MASTDNFKWLPIVNIDAPAGDGNGLQVSATKWLGRTAAQRPGVVGVCLFPGLNVGAAVISFHGLMLDGGYMDGDTDLSEHYLYENGQWNKAYDMHRYYGAYGAGNYDFGMYGSDTSYVNTLTQSSVSALATSTRGLIESAANSQAASDFYVTVSVTCVPENPYEPGGDSGESGGGGEFELENSPIPLPDLPNLNVLQTGFVKAYNPTLAELQAFQDWLWTSNPFENGWRSILGNPYDYIIGLRAIPVSPPVSENSVQVTLGNVTTPQSVTMKPITAQYVRHNFGAVDFKEYSKSFLDYSPYTRVSLYLPYIGFVKVDADIINEKTVEIQYSIDLLSGAFMAFVMSAGKVLYSFSGSMGADVPTTNQSYNNMLSGIIGTVGGLAAMGAAAFTGGLAVPMGISGLANSAAGIISAAKASVEHGNGASGVPGVMGITYPYFIIMRPMQSIPDNVQAFTGFPSNILLPLNDVSGFTKVEYVHLENISATEAEKAEIMALLKEGVIF